MAKGDWIPKEVWTNGELTRQELLILYALFPEQAEKAGFVISNVAVEMPEAPAADEKPARANQSRERFRLDILYGINNHMTKRQFDAETEKAWQEWIDYRKSIKKPLSPFTMRHQIDFLTKQPDAAACIKQSIERGWVGLFPCGGDNGRQIKGSTEGFGSGFGGRSGSDGSRNVGGSSAAQSNSGSVLRKNSQKLEEQITVQPLRRRRPVEDR